MIYCFGQSGQLGHALSLYNNVKTLPRSVADFREPDNCIKVLAQNNPTAVIIAAAYTKVDEAESNFSDAITINAETPRKIADYCGEKNIPVVYVSTDYVFPGVGSKPYLPDEDTGPINAYGFSKLQGENGLLSGKATVGVIRTSWVFSENGSNFLKTMLRLGRERKNLSVVNDQIGGPTSASALAEVCVKLANELIKNKSSSGVYHYAGWPFVSWADFAREIFDQSKMAVTVQNIETSDYPTPAKRPLNSRLDSNKICSLLSVKPCDWREDLGKIIAVRESLEDE